MRDANNAFVIVLYFALTTTDSNAMNVQGHRCTVSVILFAEIHKCVVVCSYVPVVNVMSAHEQRCDDLKIKIQMEMCWLYVRVSVCCCCVRFCCVHV